MSPGCVPLAGDAAAADDLRRRLCELSAGYAVGSAVVTEEMLRRDLSGVVRVAASPAYRASWDVLESLGRVASTAGPADPWQPAGPARRQAPASSPSTGRISAPAWSRRWALLAGTPGSW